MPLAWHLSWGCSQTVTWGYNLIWRPDWGWGASKFAQVVHGGLCPLPHEPVHKAAWQHGCCFAPGQVIQGTVRGKGPPRWKSQSLINLSQRYFCHSVEVSHYIQAILKERGLHSQRPLRAILEAAYSLAGRDGVCWGISGALSASPLALSAFRVTLSCMSC